ncbi:MAG: hypothetical protein RLZ47_1038 [Bacteroidota bacterium]|jgi:hypothetical protein
MKKMILIFLLPISLMAQVKEQKCATQKHFQDDFIRWYFKSENGWPFAFPKAKNTPIYYTGALNKYVLKLIEKEIVTKDTIFSTWEDDPEQVRKIVFDSAEKEFITNELTKMQDRILWSSKLFQNGVLLDTKKIDSLRSNLLSQFEFFQKYRDGFYEFSPPIFLRNKSICIFYCSLNCGSLCQDSRLMILKKEGTTWEKWITVFRIIS